MAKKNNVSNPTDTPPTPSTKKQDLIQLFLVAALLVAINVIGSFWFFRWDLTSEKRYTLSPETKTMLGKLEDVVYVKVYLDGDFNASFQRLRNSTQELLDEFRHYGADNIEYEFINPNAIGDEKSRNELFKQLADKGIVPTNLEVKTEEGVSQQIIFPGALVTYKGREIPVQLLQAQIGIPPEVQLNNSVQGLEYQFTNAIRKLKTTIKPRIGFLEGHGELDTLQVADIANELREYYQLERVQINGQLNALNGLKALIVAQPDSAITDRDQFILDQFIMKGGKLIWVIDQLNTSFDSLRTQGATIAIPKELRLDDMLFKYGVRINNNLIQDLQASAVPVNKALMGQPPKWELMPWIFSPLVMPTGDHPIVKNLDLIKFDFVSSIDTIATSGIRKTILLTSSKYSRLANAPVRIDLRIVNMRPNEELFKKSHQPVAVLLEGKFESLYKNRLAKELLENAEFKFTPDGIDNKMIVISDGDVIRNEVQQSSGRVFPLGYDVYSRQTFANKTFLLNCINYLCDDSGLLSVRAREIKLRLLDKKKIKTQKTKWQVINTAVPVGLVTLLGVILFYLRKRKYGVKK